MSEKPKIDEGRRKLLKFAGLAAVVGVAAAFRPLTSALLTEDKNESEDFKKLLSEVQKVITDFYHDNKAVSLEEALKKCQDLSEKIMLLLQKHNLASPNEQDAQTRVMDFFQANGYFFAVSPLALADDSYVINAPLYKIGSSKDFDLSELQVEGLPASHKKIPLLNVDKTLVADFRETPFFQRTRMIFNGMTILNAKTGDSFIVLFPDKIQGIALKEGLEPTEYKRTVEINEASHVYFSEIIPNKALGLRLAEFGIDTRGHNWTFLHLHEAFSDFASLKFGKTFRHELIRILTTANDSYDFSRTIALASVDLGLAKAGVKKQIMPENAKDIVEHLTNNELGIIKKIVIDSYEANIKAVLLRVVKKAKK